jgi:hypothetical protein
MNASWEHKYKYSSAHNDELKVFHSRIEYVTIVGARTGKSAIMVFKNFMEYL